MRIYLNTQEAFMFIRLILAKESQAFYMKTMQDVFKYSISGYKFFVDITHTWDFICLIYGTSDNYIVLYQSYLDNETRKNLDYFIKKVKKIYPAYGF